MLDTALSFLFLLPCNTDHTTDCAHVTYSFHTYVLYVDGISGEVSSVTIEQAGIAVMLGTCI
jgi:hypothetical protein